MTLEHAHPAQNGLPPKVVGLGGPISVWIYLNMIEIPALAAAIADELARYEQRPGECAAPPDDRAAHAATLRSMLADLDEAKATRTTGRFDVVWPTALAHVAVRGAVARAGRRLARAPAAEVISARLALAAAERTRDDFDAVDSGGLESVWL